MKLLITSMEDLRRYVGNVAVGMQFSQIEGDVRTATVEYMIPFLGQAFYEEVAAKVETMEDGADEHFRWLAEMLQGALANYVALKYTPVSDSFFTSMGLQTMESDSQKGAYAYQKTDRMNKYAADGDTWLDQALAFLEAHPEEFPHWNPDGRYSHWAFRSAREFDRFYGIGSSRRTFIRLLPIIRRVESLEVIPVLGIERKRMLEQWRASGEPTDSGDVSGDTLGLWLGMVQPALANLTMSRAIRELSFRPVSDAVQVASFFQPTKSTQVSESFVDRVSERAETDGQGFLHRLGFLLRDSVDGYMEFENSKDKKHFII